jgi:hypothetical protein
MPDCVLPPTNADNDWLDRVLHAYGREHRAAHLYDAGFTTQVAAALALREA